MHQPLTLLVLIVSTIAANALGPPQSHPLKRDALLSCPASNFDILCAADSGTAICHDGLDVCCQLPDGKTPYTCDSWDNPHCCGTDKPACGADPTCKNIKGDRDVASAQDAVYPTAVTVSAAPSTTATRVASGTDAAAVTLATITGEKNPNATGGADDLKRGIRKEGVLVIFVVAMALL